MAGLRATFELTDRFSQKITKIIQSADKAGKSIEGASTAADKVKTSLDKAGKSGSGAGKGFKETADGAEKAKEKVKGLGEEIKKTKTVADRVAGAMAGVFAAKTAMDVGRRLMSASDSYASANARLKLANTDSVGNTIDPAFQDKVYASAQRSRASYESTAQGISSLGLNAASAFKNQDELIGFVESINKQFAIGGVSAEAAAGAMTQLPQALGSGALRGDELNSVLEAAPSIARNIEKYMGWAEGSIKKYAEKGMLSAEMVKNAQLAAMDEIDAKFGSTPLTWSQVWTIAMNTIQRVSAPVLTGISWMANNMDVIGPIVLGIAAGFGVYAVATYGAAAAQWVLNKAGAAWNAICTMNPVGLVVIGIIGLVAALYAGVAAFNKLTGASVSATGIIGAAVYVLGAGIYNDFIFPVYNGFAMLANFIGNVFHSPVAAVKILFLDMANTCIGYVLNMARAIENIINKIPGATVDITSGLEGLKNGLEAKSKTIKDESGWKEYVKQPKLMDYSEAAGKGYAKGSALAGKVSNLVSGGSGGLNLGTIGDPAVVKGTGKNGSVKTSLEDEDISYLKDLAERDYVARIAQNTLAPNIAITFTGDINKEVDYEKIGPVVAQILQDELETEPEGIYE